MLLRLVTECLFILLCIFNFEMPEPFRINESGAVCRMYVDPVQWDVQPKQKRPPKEVNGYLLSYVIGSGAYSKVRLGVKQGSGRKVAVKVIRKQQHCREFTDKFLPRELKILRKLQLFNHPNLIKIHEVFTTVDKVYVAMDYAKGGDLLTFLNKFGPVYEWRAKMMYHQLLSALEYCHGRNIVHRDLKCENILLDKDNNVKISDFGFATNFSGSKLLETCCGSFAYAAPEVLRQQKYNGFKADVWSSGVVLYAMVCGILPYGDKQIHQLINRKQVALEFQSPHALSAECKSYIKSILKSEAFKRPTIKQLLRAPWLQHEEDSTLPMTSGDNNASRASSLSRSSSSSSCWSLLAEASLLSVGSESFCKGNVQPAQGGLKIQPMNINKKGEKCAGKAAEEKKSTKADAALVGVEVNKRPRQKAKRKTTAESVIKLPVCGPPKQESTVQHIMVQPIDPDKMQSNFAQITSKRVGDALHITPIKRTEPKLKQAQRKGSDLLKLDYLDSSIRRKKTFVLPPSFSPSDSSSYLHRNKSRFDNYILQGVPVPTSNKGALSTKPKGVGIDPNGAPINVFRPKTKSSSRKQATTPLAYSRQQCPPVTMNQRFPRVNTPVNPRRSSNNGNFLMNMLNDLG